MSRAGRVALVAAAGLLLAGAALALVTRPEAGGPAVVVTDQVGREVASVPLPDGGRSPSATATRSTGPR